MSKWICACAVVVIIIFVWLIWLSPAFSRHSQNWLKTTMTLPVTCADSKAMDNRLKDTHGKEHIWRGVIDPGRLLVIYQSEGGGWTAVVVSATGRSCSFASGS